MSSSLPVIAGPCDATNVNGSPTVALAGNPNAGKTTLFNRLTGLRARTANFPGTTVEFRKGSCALAGRSVTLVDLPGLYSLDAVTPDEGVACDEIRKSPPEGGPNLIVLVLDATNLERNLFLASQVLELGRPVVVALNMADAADAAGLSIDAGKLAQQLGCPVKLVSARTGAGLDDLKSSMAQFVASPLTPIVTEELASCGSCPGCQFAARYDWAERVATTAVHGDSSMHGRRSERIDRVLTHRVTGLVCFAAVMTGMFATIFWLAQYPMQFIETIFAWSERSLGSWLPSGIFNSLITEGVIGAVGSVLVFLPQICLLFFLLTLLEDTGYLARAAFVMDRLMHRVGLPGKAFVPMLSAHACAIPAILSTRVIEDRRDRLATIMVMPLLTCSARLPVYSMVMGLLFPDHPLKAAALFAGAYALGIVAALGTAWLFRRTFLKGPTRPLVIELPNYRIPSLRTALLVTMDRALDFVRNAGTTILAISLVMWALAAFPRTDPASLPEATRTALSELEARGDSSGAERLLAQTQLEHSAIGRLGRAIEPVFAPLGFDWRTSVGVLSSFAAREVLVSTLSVLYGVEDDGGSLRHSLSQAKGRDGSPAFTTANCLSLLVFFVLAMQCLPTQAVVRRETGSWKWPTLQMTYMSLLAYGAAWATHAAAIAAGW
jgi:ferrous iron transport protein B